MRPVHARAPRLFKNAGPLRAVWAALGGRIVWTVRGEVTFVTISIDFRRFFYMPISESGGKRRKEKRPKKRKEKKKAKRDKASAWASSISILSSFAASVPTCSSFCATARIRRTSTENCGVLVDILISRNRNGNKTKQASILLVHSPVQSPFELLLASGYGRQGCS
jgi:hypothetical protein